MTAVFLYDGDCGFCTICAGFIARRIPTSAQVLPWQRADLPALGVTPGQCADAVQWIDGAARPAAGPDGIARLLRSSSASYWRAAGWVLERAAVRAVAWPVYRWVAAHRHRMPGSDGTCAVPPRQPGVSGGRPAPESTAP